MLCRVCEEDKLSREFIPYAVTADCRHPRLLCLRCATKAASVGKCPYKNCGQPLLADSPEIKEFNAILNCLFKEVDSASDAVEVENAASVVSSISVVMLTGERTMFPFNPLDTVSNLKRKISNQTKIEIPKQRLLYGEQELTELFNGNQARLIDFDVKPNSSIFLMVLLYAIPSSLNHVTFDLFWGYPARGCDFLDASCILYQGQHQLGIVDYHRSSGSAVRHSGDVMDNQHRIGHHTINVSLHQIPAHVTHLFFTLSAYNSPTIAHFPNPSLKFYETSKPNLNLCKTIFTHARNSEAVIMCSVSRVGNQWNIFESGKLSAGCAKNYGPLDTTIRQLIQTGV